MRMFLILFVLLFCSAAQAQALAVRTTETECTPQGCRQLTGTGACAFVGNVGERSVYLTAAHNVLKSRTVHVGYGGHWWPARVVFQDYRDNIDYAILETQKIPATVCFEVSDRQPQDGVDAVAYGYSNGVYNLRSLRAKIRVTRDGRYFSKVVARGDSGGPILVNGQVVGIIKGHNTQSTVYTNSVLIRGQLLQLYGRIPCCNCRPPVVVDVQPKSDSVVVQDSEQVKALESRLAQLQAQLDQLAKTQIPVQLIGADGEVKQEEKYQLGSPIKLRFKAVNK